MSRAQAFELNNHSYATVLHPSKKVSLPPAVELPPHPPKTSLGALRRTTTVPIAVLPPEVPSYFESTMQSMCLACFTFAYTEVLSGWMCFVASRSPPV